MRKTSLLSLVLTLGLILGYAAQGASLPETGMADDKFLEGESLFRAGGLSEAKPYYEAVKKKYPADRAGLIARLRLGKIHLTQKNYDGARKEYIEAGKAFPRTEQNGAILFGLAQAEFGLKQFPAAMKLLKRLPSPRPADAVALAFKIALAQEDRILALRLLDEQAELAETKKNEASLSQVLGRAKILVKGFKTRPELEELHEVVANNDIKAWIETRLGRSGSRDPASTSQRTAAAYRDRNWRRPQLLLTPGVSLFSAEAADRGTGSSAVLVSNPVPALAVQLNVPVAQTIDIFAFVDGALVSLKAPGTRTLTNASQMDFEFSAGPRFFFSRARRVSVSLSFGMSQEILSRATSATNLTIEREMLPKIGLQALIEMLQSPSFSLFVEGGAGSYFGKSTGAAGVSSGLSYFGKLTGKFTMSPSSDFRVGLFLNSVKLTTLAELKQNSSLGLETGFCFHL